MDDQEFVLMLMRWGQDGRMVVLLGLILIGLIGLNVWLGCRIWRRRKDGPETVIDWSQNLDELEVDFPLPEGVTSKDVKCRITSTTIYFAFTKGDTTPMLEGTLYRSVQPDECNWQLWPVGAPTHAKLSLVKAKTGQWKNVLAEEDKKSS